MRKNARVKRHGRIRKYFCFCTQKSDMICIDKSEFVGEYVMKNIKTIKWLRISIILQVIFTSFCISSLICLLIHKYFNIDVFFSLGNVLIYGWIINPVGLITLITGLILFFIDKKDIKNSTVIGKKWIWFILFFIFDIILYLISGVLLVTITGGV